MSQQDEQAAADAARAAEQAQAAAAAEAAEQEAARVAAEQEAEAQAAAAQQGGDPNKPADEAPEVPPDEVDHGEPDPLVEAEHQQQLATAQDPWGTTPTQMRDVHDPAVDPAKIGVATRPDGSGLIAPQVADET